MLIGFGEKFGDVTMSNFFGVSEETKPKQNMEKSEQTAFVLYRECYIMTGFIFS